MEKCRRKFKKFIRKQVAAVGAALLLTLIQFTAMAQDGIAGFNEANAKVLSYFSAGTQLMYAVEALHGLIETVKVYQKWNAGDQNTGKIAAA